MKTSFGELASDGMDSDLEQQKAKGAELKRVAAEKKIQEQEGAKQKGQLIGSLLGAIVGGIAGAGNPMAISAGASAGGAIGGGVGGAAKGDMSGLGGVLQGAMSMPGGGELLGMEGAKEGSSIMQAGQAQSKLSDLEKLYKSGLIDENKYTMMKKYLSE